MTSFSVPAEIEAAANLGAIFALNISGGKDSGELFRQVATWHQAGGYPGQVVAVHADLGRADWPQSRPMCEMWSSAAGIPLEVVRRSDGLDLVDVIARRMDALQGTGKPFWPSSGQRYCTSDLKRDPIDKFYRSLASDLIISVEGIRAEESPARAKKQPLTVRSRITAKALRKQRPERALDSWEPEVGRLALTWFPLFDLSEQAVYEGAGHTIEERDERRAWYRAGQVERALAGWLMHPAYVFGSNRVSCTICVLAALGDLRVGAQHDPALLAIYRRWEQETGFTFKAKWSLEEVVR